MDIIRIMNILIVIENISKSSKNNNEIHKKNSTEQDPGC